MTSLDQVQLSSFRPKALANGVKWFITVNQFGKPFNLWF